MLIVMVQVSATQGCKLGSRKKSEMIHKTFSDNLNLSSTCVKSDLKMKFKR